jgi:hypothetical protein
MLVNALLPAFNPVMLRRGCSSFKRRYARTDTRGSVRRASGFVLTGKPEVDLNKADFPLLIVHLDQITSVFADHTTRVCLARTVLLHVDRLTFCIRL